MPDLPWDLNHRPLIVAAVTPLRDGGASLDEEAAWPIAQFLADAGTDGVFACGTTGEGILLTTDERRRMAIVYRAAVRGILVVHCGAQTTAETSELAAHAAEIGADAVAVIPPPYFPLDADALVDHLVAAASAAAPLPFFIYAFTARSGYSVTPEVIERVRERAGNLAGLKVSETPYEKVKPYLGLGLPVLVGSEPLIPAAVADGAAGAVSGLASAFPDLVRAGLDDPDGPAGARLAEVRAAMEAQPFIAAAKHVLARRGVAVQPDMRLPMRRLTKPECAQLDASIAELGIPGL